MFPEIHLEHRAQFFPIENNRSAFEKNNPNGWYKLQKDKRVFQHDNDPKHTARSTREWLKENSIKVLDWPAQSPDMNPIEHLWQHLKQQLAQYKEPPKGVQELWERIEKVREAIEPDFCARLIESMPARIAVVIEAKGGHTKWVIFFKGRPVVP